MYTAESKAKLIAGVKYIAKNKPVIICVVKHNPNKEPNLHIAEIFLGQANWTTELRIIRTGFVFIKGFVDIGFARLFSLRLS